MATSSQIHLVPTKKPEFAVANITEESARKASELLQENHDRHHIFFNEEGFHNHIAHHLLTIYALGADAKTLEKMYDENLGYQRPQLKVEKQLVSDMHDRAKFNQYLGNEKYYVDFLVFFQQEIEKKGWEEVLNDYLFTGTDESNDLLVRTFAGFLHPLIHLGFGVEFEQPAIIAEALAEAAVHENWIAPILLESEEAANKLKSSGSVSKSIMQLLDDIRTDEKLVESVHFSDSSKIRDGIIARAPERMIHHASQFYIKDESELEMRTAEMMHLVAYFTMAAQRPPKDVKVDFYYMHSVNSGIFFTRFLKVSKFSAQTKGRLLEWKVRADLALYVSRHSPELSADVIKNYKPREKADNDPWPHLYERICRHADDGHASKLIRALAHTKDVCKPWEDKPELQFKIRGDMWDKLGEMAFDSVEHVEGPSWIRGAGWEDAWKDVPERTSKL